MKQVEIFLFYYLLFGYMTITTCKNHNKFSYFSFLTSYQMPLSVIVRKQGPTPHSVALATVRDATVTFGAGYGALLVPVERRITQYLRQERLFVVRCCPKKNRTSRWLLRSQDDAWVLGPDMATERWFPGVNETGKLSSCERLNSVTGNWISGPEMTMPNVGNCVVLQGEDYSTERLDASTYRWVRGPDTAIARSAFSVAVRVF